MEKKLDARLLAALQYLTPGGAMADIGTDHAYLPIEAIRRGISSRAIACDINRGPIERAREHIAEAGLSDRISTLQTDGLHGVEDFAPNDILIFGMGGELILRILSEAPWIRDPAVRLILQPMSHPELLRRWLLENGFGIMGETLAYQEQYYQIIHAAYGSSCLPHSELELHLGRELLASRSPHLAGFLRRRISVLSEVVAGKQRGGADAAAEQALLGAMQEKLNEAEQAAKEGEST